LSPPLQSVPSAALVVQIPASAVEPSICGGTPCGLSAPPVVAPPA